MGSIDVAWVPLGSTLLIDTAPLIYAFENHPTFAPRLTPLFDAHGEGRFKLAVSSITLAELLVQPFQRQNEALARRYRTRLLSWTCVDVNPEIAVAAARLRAAHGLRLADALQAATALAIDAAALVSNDKAFAQIPSLRVLF